LVGEVDAHEGMAAMVAVVRVISPQNVCAWRASPDLPVRLRRGAGQPGWRPGLSMGGPGAAICGDAAEPGGDHLRMQAAWLGDDGRAAGETAGSLAGQERQSAFCSGRRLAAVDGMCLDLSDADENGAEFGYLGSDTGPWSVPQVGAAGVVA
jgi:hypothetical protein